MRFDDAVGGMNPLLSGLSGVTSTDTGFTPVWGTNLNHGILYRGDLHQIRFLRNNACT